MKAGKLKESVLKRSVLKQLHKRKESTLVGPSVGTDYGAVDEGYISITPLTNNLNIR